MPFTHDEFFEVFAAYNQALWPGAVVLWVASLAACGALLAGHRSANRIVAVVLTAHWAWSALAYHAFFFTRINPAAWLFAGLFLLQAGLCAWQGVFGTRLRFGPVPGTRLVVAWSLIAYSLVYPAIGLAQGLRLPHMPTFGVPCPTTILTAGFLLLSIPRPRWIVTAIPIAWSVVGGSAAFLLDVRADFALPVAGLALAWVSVSAAPAIER